MPWELARLSVEAPGLRRGSIPSIPKHRATHPGTCTHTHTHTHMCTHPDIALDRFRIS